MQVFFMTRDKQIEERLAKIRCWAQRIEKLASRKRKALSEAAFCRKHKFHQAHLNRTKNGLSFPGENYFEAVEKALKIERV